MKSTLAKIFVFIFLSLTANAQLTFEKTYGSSGTDKARSVCQTSDGGFALTGFTSGTNDLTLLKTNEYGDSLWSHIYPIASGSDGWSIKQTYDGGFIIGGYLTHPPAPQDLYILKTDSLG